MREQKFHIYLDCHERTILLHSLVGAPLKKLKVQHDCGRV